MPHYPGHIPDGSLIIQDVLIDKTFRVHGYLFIDKPNGTPDESTRILFLNNCGLAMPKNVNSKVTLEGLSQAQIDRRKVGFNLLLIDMPQTKQSKKSKWGIAYNLAKWPDHENTEEAIRKLKRYTGKRLEDIDPADVSNLAQHVENRTADGKVIIKNLGSTSPAIAVSILKQSADYMQTESFKLSRAENYYDWIKNNVADFEDMADLFGKY